MQNRYALPVLALVVATAWSAFPAKAEVTGQATFTFEGKTTQWFTQSREIRGKMRHSATLNKDDIFDAVEITSYPEEGEGRERLEIMMVFTHGPLAKSTEDYSRPTSTSIIYLLGGITGPRWEARDITFDFSLNESSETAANVTGTFAATLCYKAEIYAGAAEDSCQAASGTFDTALVVEHDE